MHEHTLAVKPKLASGPQEKLCEDRILAVARLVADLHKENVAANDETASDCGYTQRDPVVYSAGINLYAYADNNPAVYTDRRGTTAFNNSLTNFATFNTKRSRGQCS